MIQGVRDIQKGLAILIDPDKQQHISGFLQHAPLSKIDCFFVGGSGELSASLEDLIDTIKSNSSIPCYIFPGSENQISPKADGLMVLSLLSGRNPDYLIGKLIDKSKEIKQGGMATLSVGYILIDGGVITSTMKVTNTNPIPADQTDLIVRTALAAELIGMQAIYLEAGSGAAIPISPDIVRAVKKETNLPLIVGGGIRAVDTAKALWEAGANLIVVGNVLEKSPSFIHELSLAK